MWPASFKLLRSYFQHRSPDELSLCNPEWLAEKTLRGIGGLGLVLSLKYAGTLQLPFRIAQIPSNIEATRPLLEVHRGLCGPLS